MEQHPRGFWAKKRKPWYVLAPMADVTDAAFRRIIAKYGQPDVLWTEFVSCDGLCSDKGRKRLLRDLEYHESERPIVAQIFGKNPETFHQAAKLCQELGFDGIDINMGCPEKSICASGSCSALIKTPELAQEIVRATQAGAGNLPVTVKTRLGFSTNVVEEWVGALLETKPVAIIMHGRTRKEMSKVPANWDEIARGAKLAEGTGTLFLGNGDVQHLNEADEKIAQYGVDGVMVGRGIFGNPWLFGRRPDFVRNWNEELLAGREEVAVSLTRAEVLQWRNAFGLSLEEKLEVMLEHAFLYEELFSDIKNFHIMRKHFKAYVAGFPHTKGLKMALMETENANDALHIVKIWKEGKEA